ARGGGRGVEAPGVGDEGFDLERQGPAFGGAAGIVMLIYRNGQTYVPPAQRYRIPADSRMKALAASGRGSYSSDVHASGTHIRVLVKGIGSRGALAIALTLKDVDHTLSSQPLLHVLIADTEIAMAALTMILV